MKRSKTTSTISVDLVGSDPVDIGDLHASGEFEYDCTCDGGSATLSPLRPIRKGKPDSFFKSRNPANYNGIYMGGYYGKLSHVGSTSEPCISDELEASGSSLKGSIVTDQYEVVLIYNPPGLSISIYGLGTPTFTSDVPIVTEHIAVSCGCCSECHE
jgi:hypothetical protein